jgi:pyruvate dehydrogenase E1 component alpha subunit
MASIVKSKPEGKAKPAPPGETFSLVSNEKLLAIYAAMVKCRMVQQRATALFQGGKLTTDLHASSGREAVAAAVAIDLQPGDSLSLSAGDWLPAMIKGVALETIFHALAAAPAHQAAPVACSVEMEQKNILFGGEKRLRAAVAEERARSAKAAKQGSIVAAILPSSEDLLERWHDVLAEAASQRLPIVFVHYADAGAEQEISRPSPKRKNPDAFYHGVPVITVDALDAVAVYRVAYEAIVRARQGRGASLLECAGVSTPLVSGANGLETSATPPPLADPVGAMEAYLKNKGIASAQHNQEVVAAFNAELDLATRFLNH